ncbi:E7 protein [Human papillomavirus type 216]|uniref:Protein E7 n=2 Tax=Human papillomavirus types TaxID=173087 RepID=A0A2H4V8G7_9PAPI|nr:E7 protein [Human papillomavirus type 216]AYA93938.1 MAG: E7 protein [Human papillomavirus]
MQGKEPSLKDITLELSDLVMPENLLSNESLSADEDPEEEQVTPYRVDSCCPNCHKRVRVCVLATDFAIYQFERLLLEQLQFICPGCSRVIFSHGRTN